LAHQWHRPPRTENPLARWRRAWRGEAELGAIFWIDGVLASSLLVALYATTVVLGQRFAEQVLLILCAGYTLWILVSIWRCSQVSESFWSRMARLMTIAWAADTALVLAFRQLDLLIAFAGP
jgi:hypothetical protein